MANLLHLTLEERTVIQSMPVQLSSFTEIGNALGRDRTTISKEVRGHLVFRRGGYQRVNYNAWAQPNVFLVTGAMSALNANQTRHTYKLCRRCSACNKFCPDFVEVICLKLLKKPYVCNGCGSRYSGCTLEKRFYYTEDVQEEYKETLS